MLSLLFISPLILPDAGSSKRCAHFIHPQVVLEIYRLCLTTPLSSTHTLGGWGWGLVSAPVFCLDSWERIRRDERSFCVLPLYVRAMIRQCECDCVCCGDTVMFSHESTVVQCEYRVIVYVVGVL